MGMICVMNINVFNAFQRTTISDAYALYKLVFWKSQFFISIFGNWYLMFDYYNILAFGYNCWRRFQGFLGACLGASLGLLGGILAASERSWALGRSPRTFWAPLREPGAILGVFLRAFWQKLGVRQTLQKAILFEHFQYVKVIICTFEWKAHFQ